MSEEGGKTPTPKTRSSQKTLTGTLRFTTNISPERLITHPPSPIYPTPPLQMGSLILIQPNPPCASDPPPPFPRPQWRKNGNVHQVEGWRWKMVLIKDLTTSVGHFAIKSRVLTNFGDVFGALLAANVWNYIQRTCWPPQSLGPSCIDHNQSCRGDRVLCYIPNWQNC